MGEVNSLGDWQLIVVGHCAIIGSVDKTEAGLQQLRNKHAYCGPNMLCLSLGILRNDVFPLSRMHSS